MRTTCSISIVVTLACGLLLSTSAWAASSKPVGEQSKLTALLSLEMCKDFFGIEPHKGTRATEAAESVGAEAHAVGENVTCSEFTSLCLEVQEVAHCRQMTGSSPRQ
ncbi:MAG: hypothetical protein O2910_00385 [Proteobacteria bacterium]|nr:hypothetical protein [Pseudomonadota bacterium]